MEPDYSILLRPARPEDSDGVRELVFGILLEHGLQPDAAESDADLEAPDAWYTSRGGNFWVMIDDGRIVGTVGIIPDANDTVELRKMYLDKDYRGRLLGQRLLDHAIEWARDRGFHHMELETSTALEAAISLYRKYGFQETDVPNRTSRCNMTMRLEL